MAVTLSVCTPLRVNIPRKEVTIPREAEARKRVHLVVLIQFIYSFKSKKNISENKIIRQKNVHLKVFHPINRGFHLK